MFEEKRSTPLECLKRDVSGSWMVIRQHRGVSGFSVWEGRRRNFPCNATEPYRRDFVKAGKRILAYGIRHTCQSYRLT